MVREKEKDTYKLLCSCYNHCRKLVIENLFLDLLFFRLMVFGGHDGSTQTSFNNDIKILNMGILELKEPSNSFKIIVLILWNSSQSLVVVPLRLLVVTVLRFVRTVGCLCLEDSMERDVMVICTQ